MSVTFNELPSPEPEEETLSVILSRLDDAHTEFFASSARYTHIPISTYAQRVVEGAEIVTSAMRDSTKFILCDGSTDVQQKGGMIATLFQDDDKKRVACFGGLVSDKALFSEASSDRETIINDIVNDLSDGTNWDEVLAKIMGAYRHNVGIDLEKFLEHVPTGRNAKVLKISKAIGKHTFDVVKTSAGMALGVAVAIQWARRRG